jgi:hypothetical protein
VGPFCLPGGARRTTDCWPFPALRSAGSTCGRRDDERSGDPTSDPPTDGSRDRIGDIPRRYDVDGRRTFVVCPRHSSSSLPLLISERITKEAGVWSSTVCRRARRSLILMMLDAPQICRRRKVLPNPGHGTIVGESGALPLLLTSRPLLPDDLKPIRQRTYILVGSSSSTCANERNAIKQSNLTTLYKTIYLHRTIYITYNILLVVLFTMRTKRLAHS